MLSIVLLTFINYFCVNLFHFQAAMIGTSDAPPQNVLPFQNVYHNQVSRHSVFDFSLSISCTVTIRKLDIQIPETFENRTF